MTAMLYHYRGADGIWRDRCARHIKATGPYRAVTTPQPSACTICVECRPWGGPAIKPEDTHAQSQLEQLDPDHEQPRSTP